MPPALPPRPPRDSATMKRREKRRKIIEELVKTEETYIAGLRAVVANYMTPLDKLVGSRREILSKAEIVRIFGEIPNILSIQKELLTGMSKVLADVRGEKESGATSRKRRLTDVSQNVGDVFHGFAPVFRLYSAFVSTFEANMEFLAEIKATRKHFQNFLTKCREKSKGTLQCVESYLIMPVQRVPRYKLLLEELLKCTDSQSSDHASISLAVDSINRVTKHVNDSCGEADRSKRMFDIQAVFGDAVVILKPGRQFVAELKGRVNAEYGNSTAEHGEADASLFIFSDSLLLGLRALGGADVRKYVPSIHNFILLGDIASVEIMPGSILRIDDLKIKCVASPKRLEETVQLLENLAEKAKSKVKGK